MKLSVSVPEPDVEFLDDYAKRAELPSRSAAIQAAVRALQTLTLGDLYQAAWDEWAPEQATWDVAIGDGLTDEAW